MKGELIIIISITTFIIIMRRRNMCCAVSTKIWGILQSDTNKNLITYKIKKIKKVEIQQGGLYMHLDGCEIELPNLYLYKYLYGTCTCTCIRYPVSGIRFIRFTIRYSTSTYSVPY